MYFSWACLLWAWLQNALGQKWALADQDDDTMPGVVYVRFIDGRAPFGGVQSGFSSFDQLTTDLQVRSLTRAFPIADAIAAKQPASESTRWLQGVYRLEYNAPIAPIQCSPVAFE